MKQLFKDLKLPLLLVALLSLCATLSLPIIPFDETRYVSVAWEMWNHHSFLVPLLNGEPYSHKPPMLFWMIQAGWKLFGVNDFSPRLIPGIFSLFNLILVYRISLRIWPQERKTAVVAVWVLASTLIWDLWSVAIMFDMVLTFWVLLGLLGTLRAAAHHRDGWLLLTAGIAGGLLTKGPAVFVYLLSIPLFRAWWDTQKEKPVRATWYLSLLGCAAIGFAGALLWAIPAAMQGGDAYGQAILWGQTAGRVSSASAAHGRPIWWYLPIVPLFFFPWILFCPSFAKFRLKTADGGTRFCMVWLGLPLLIFSLVSGKQIHYLIPFIPAGAMLIARNLIQSKESAGGASAKAIGTLFILLGITALMIPLVYLGSDVGHLNFGSTRFAACGLLIAGLLLFIPFHSTSQMSRRLALSMVLALFFTLFQAKSTFMKGFDIKAVSELIKGKIDSGHMVVNVGQYHDQFHFLGRLEQPLTVLQRENEIPEFSIDHPDALYITYEHEHYTLPDDAEIISAISTEGKIWSFGESEPHPSKRFCGDA